MTEGKFWASFWNRVHSEFWNNHAQDFVLCKECIYLEECRLYDGHGFCGDFLKEKWEKYKSAHTENSTNGLADL